MIKALFLSASLLCIAGCDQDPLGRNTKKIAGHISLHQFEGGVYYLVAPGQESGGGIIDGTVQEIGWSKEVILAKRKANFGGDGDGWMVIDIVTKKVLGPIPEEVRRTDPRYRTIITEPVAVVWKR